jgi:2-dehydro-3-deoxyphosphogluconate aldolase / (4S)-4-hydroxy-2-oxoglutarate aldolase
MRTTRLTPPPGPVIAILRGHDPTAVARIVDGLVAGGVTTIEVTLDSPGALASITSLASRGGVIAGAGTVLSEQAAVTAIDAGAAFLVAPHVDRRVVDAAASRGVAMLPGALTPTEIITAWQAGAAAVKLFPAGVLGPAYLAAVRAPLSHIPLVATGGIDDRNAAAFLAAGSVALGVGGWLTAGSDPSIVSERAERLLAAIRSGE